MRIERKSSVSGCCQYPFTRMEFQLNQKIYFCCSNWLPHPIGDLKEISIEEAWNSKMAQDIRASIGVVSSQRDVYLL